MDDAHTSATAINITLDLLPLGVGIVLLPLTVAAAMAALRKQPPPLSRELVARLGLGALPSGVVIALGLLWLILFTTFVAGILWVIGSLMWRGPAMTAAQAPDYRWHLLTLTALTAALGAIVALPFTLLRTGYAARQTRTAEENLTTDLINKAVEGLGAQKEVNRLGRTVKYNDEQGLADSTFRWAGENLFDDLPITDISDWQNITLTVPNIEVRLGAIYALERIAQDSPRDHIRVMEILCAYLRENAPARDARRHDLGPWPEYPTDPSEDDLKARAKTLEDRREALALWIDDLREHHAPRADIQAAITVIGRRSPAQIALEQAPKEDGTRTYRLDLRKLNLQAADLAGLNLANARLDASHLKGADLGGAHLEGVVLDEAQLEGAFLFRAHLERAFLSEAHLEGSSLSGAHLERASLSGARLEGAACRGARLEGANLFRAHLSDETSFRPATLRGAGLRGVNLSIAITEDDALPCLLAEAFGDASVKLPEGLKAGDPPLEHWFAETLDLSEFEPAWRAHQRAIGYVPPD